MLIHRLFYKTALIDQGDNSTVIHAVLDGILMNQLAKFGHGVLFLLHQRCAGEANVAGVREHAAHLGCHETVVGTVTFVYQNKYIPREVFGFQTFNGVKLIDNTGDDVGF